MRRAFAKFALPNLTASTFSESKSLRATPPCHFKPRTVATTTAALGAGPPWRTLMSMNFWKPRSAPNPASVTVMSELFVANMSARIELQPCAMLPNGPM